MSDAEAASALLALDAADAAARCLEHRTEALVRLAGLVALSSAPASYHAGVAEALAEGASEEDVVAVLVCLAPVVGTARVIQAAPEVALALGYDVESALEGRRSEEGGAAAARRAR